MDIDAYPLQWPAGWQRTPFVRRRPSQYRVTFAKAREQLLKELYLLGAQDVVISTSVPLRQDGLPYANTREPEDPGVAVYWTTRKRKEQRVVACDSWRTVRSNLRAVGLAIQALRLIERTGASQIMERAYSGFAALPPASDWWRSELNLPDDFDEETIRVRYRERAYQCHPDTGGSDLAMARLNQAREAALACLREKEKDPR